jgi:hypothetical protein
VLYVDNIAPSTASIKSRTQQTATKHQFVCYFPEMKTCSVCIHEEKDAIDAALLNNVPLRTIAAQTGVGPWAIHRHRKHLPAQLVKARDAEEVADANSLLARVERLIKRCETIATAAEKQKKWAPAVSALREVRSALELLARLRGDLDRARVNVRIHQMNQVNISVAGGDPDREIALLIAHVTHGFDPGELARFRDLAAVNEADTRCTVIESACEQRA